MNRKALDYFKIFIGSLFLSCSIFIKGAEYQISLEKIASAAAALSEKYFFNETIQSYQCIVCPKQCKKESHMASHAHSHITESLYHCPFCAQKIKRPDAVKRHINQVHLKIRPYGCNKCEKKFKRKEHLAEHAKTHPSVTEKPEPIAQNPPEQEALKLAAASLLPQEPSPSSFLDTRIQNNCFTTNELEELLLP